LIPNPIKDRLPVATAVATALPPTIMFHPTVRAHFDAISTLAGGAHPKSSWAGVAVTGGAIVVMPRLARAKGRVAAQLGSGATAGDSAQSWLCATIAAAALVSILANATLGWWWLDPIAAAGIAGLAVHEGREAWAGEVCADFPAPRHSLQ
jgi:divalent metal cation (Fe/Co/Zn/Cd) transporter